MVIVYGRWICICWHLLTLITIHIHNSHFHIICKTAHAQFFQNHFFYNVNVILNQRTLVLVTYSRNYRLLFLYFSIPNRLLIATNPGLNAFHHSTCLAIVMYSFKHELLNKWYRSEQSIYRILNWLFYQNIN